MHPIIYINCNLNNVYSENNFVSRIKDSFSIKMRGISFIEELGLNIIKVKLPSNFHEEAYYRNVMKATKYAKVNKAYISPKTYRVYDYRFFSTFQKRFIAYSAVKSIELSLRMSNKSIKNSCIVIYDAAYNMENFIIEEISKKAKYIVLLSDDIRKISKLQEYIIANYGISPVVTRDKDYALSCADFIVDNKGIKVEKNIPIWYTDNRQEPTSKNIIAINDVDYKIPWECEGISSMPPELLGAILEQMEEKDIDKSLNYNGIVIDNIKYNNVSIPL